MHLRQVCCKHLHNEQRRASAQLWGQNRADCTGIQLKQVEAAFRPIPVFYHHLQVTLRIKVDNSKWVEGGSRRGRNTKGVLLCCWSRACVCVYCSDTTRVGRFQFQELSEPMGPQTAWVISDWLMESAWASVCFTSLASYGITSCNQAPREHNSILHSFLYSKNNYKSDQSD